jgi:uncharacterized protein (TIGR00251 family)
MSLDAAALRDVVVDVVGGKEPSVRVFVRAQPRASREAFVGVHDGALKVAITAPPVDGEANDALVRALAKKLGVPARNVSLDRGASGRSKTFVVVGLDAATAIARLVD